MASDFGTERTSYVSNWVIRWKKGSFMGYLRCGGDWRRVDISFRSPSIKETSVADALCSGNFPLNLQDLVRSVSRVSAAGDDGRGRERREKGERERRRGR